VPLHTDYHYVFDAMFFYEVAQRFKWIERDTPIAGYRLHQQNKSPGIKADRIRELAALEALKFGPQSMRARYLSGVAWAGLVETVGCVPPASCLAACGLHWL
jgi:hypothetical protein